MMDTGRTFRFLAFATMFLSGSVFLTSARGEAPKVAPGATEPEVAVSGLSPGGKAPTVQTSEAGRKADGNPDQIAEGRALFAAYNCNGCHANGGGGMGPPLTAHAWRYGNSIENIAADIFEGRPNGMPTWRGKIPDQLVWSIAAYVRSLTPNGPTDPMKAH